MNEQRLSENVDKRDDIIFGDHGAEHYGTGVRRFDDLLLGTFVQLIHDPDFGIESAVFWYGEDSSDLTVADLCEFLENQHKRFDVVLTGHTIPAHRVLREGAGIRIDGFRICAVEQDGNEVTAEESFAVQNMFFGADVCSLFTFGMKVWYD